MRLQLRLETGFKKHISCRDMNGLISQENYMGELKMFSSAATVIEKEGWYAHSKLWPLNQIFNIFFNT